LEPLATRSRYPSGIAAIRAVLAGRSYFSPKVGRLLREEHVEQLRREGRADSFELLTAREREVLQLVAEGNSNKEIAERLFLSVLTVETHRKKILDKLHLRGTPELVLYAVRKGLISTVG
jgi:DNA-binding NarL/FixJ family response regulator